MILLVVGSATLTINRDRVEGWLFDFYLSCGYGRSVDDWAMVEGKAREWKRR